MKKKLSVIVPVYNAEKYIERCIKSILNQTYPSVEIILVDDGCKDKSPQICDKLSNENRNVKVIHQENAGVSVARQTGFNASNGELIGYVDADDYISPVMYETLIALMEEKKADFALSGYGKEQSDGTFVPYNPQEMIRVFNRQEMIANMLNNKYYTCSVCGGVFPRHILEQVTWQTGIAYYEDMKYLYEIMIRSTDMVYTSEPLYYYCTNQGSVSLKSFNAKMMTMIDVYDYIYDDVTKRIPELKKSVRKQFVRNNLMCAMAAARSNYQDRVHINRLQTNVRKNLLFYLLSDSSFGYKIRALLLSLKWELLCWVQR